MSSQKDIDPQTDKPKETKVKGVHVMAVPQWEPIQVELPPGLLRKNSGLLQATFSLPTPAMLDPPEAEHDEQQMVEDDRIITKGGSRYLPIALAAERAQVPRTTLANWIKAKAQFQGRPLQIYNSPTAHKSFLSEESVQRVANRFVKWPSQEPAGAVKMGETKDQKGYIGIAKAARAIGIDHHTMWLWTTQGKAPTDRTLDVIKCTASDQFYIRQRELAELKKHIPRSGLRRGRRPQLAASKP